MRAAAVTDRDVLVRGRINHVFSTSLEVGIRIEQVWGASVNHPASCYLTMVARHAGQSLSLPPLTYAMGLESLRSDMAIARRHAYRDSRFATQRPPSEDEYALLARLHAAQDEVDFNGLRAAELTTSVGKRPIRNTNTFLESEISKPATLLNRPQPRPARVRAMKMGARFTTPHARNRTPATVSRIRLGWRFTSRRAGTRPCLRRRKGNAGRLVIGNTLPEFKKFADELQPHGPCEIASLRCGWSGRSRCGRAMKSIDHRSSRRLTGSMKFPRT